MEESKMISENAVVMNLLVPRELKEIQVCLPKEADWPAVGPKMVPLEEGWTRDYTDQAGGPATVTVIKVGRKRPDHKSRMVQLRFDGNVKQAAIKPVIICS